MNNLVKYNDGEIEVQISIEEELYEDSTIRNFRIVQKEGKREVIFNDECLILNEEMAT